MRTNNFALRLPDSLYTGLKEAAAADNVAMNQYLTIALAEKLSALATIQKHCPAVRLGIVAPITGASRPIWRGTHTGPRHSSGRTWRNHNCH